MPGSPARFFFLCALEGAAATAALFLIPSEGGRLSPARLGLIGVTAGLAAGWAVVGLRRPGALARFARPPFIALTALLALLAAALLFFLRYLNPGESLSTYHRLSPLLWYLLVLCIQVSLYLLVLSRGLHPANLSAARPTYRPALAAFCVLIALAMFVGLTRLGLTPDSAYWGEPGVPLQGWQFALALVGGAAAASLASAPAGRRAEILLPAGLYLLALAVWLSVPVEVLANSFYMPISPPAFQPFPYSDAGYYDQMAHSLLIGHPYQGTIPTRPLYIVLLTFLHLLFGENYRTILAGQTALLALIPVVFYALGGKLHSPAAGVVIALFFIFRELATLLVSSETRVSNTKMLLVDLPTLLLLLLTCLAAMRWLARTDRRSALIAGGTFGLLLLLRTQAALVLPWVLILALLAGGWKTRTTYLRTGFFLLGLMAAVLPWLLHNYLQTGQFAFDAPFQYRVIASQYAYSGNLDIEAYDFEGKGLARVLIDFALRDPAFVAGFIATHFLAAQVHGLLALPLIKPFHGIFEPVNLYWMEWNGSLEGYNAALLLLYLGVIALGLGAAWRRWRWIGLLPLSFSAGYALATAVGRFSGWRYDLPADWLWYFYFGIGFGELLVLARLLFGGRAGLDRDPASPRGGRQPVLGPALVFALLGALPWLVTAIASPRYPEAAPQILLERAIRLAEPDAAGEITAFAAQPEAVLQRGRVLYPRFFGREDGLSSTHPWPAYAPRAYPRMGFVLLNETSTSVLLPTRRLPGFPHAADAIVLGCQRDGYVEARWVFFPGLRSTYAAAGMPRDCSAAQ